MALSSVIAASFIAYDPSDKLVEMRHEFEKTGVREIVADDFGYMTSSVSGRTSR